MNQLFRLKETVASYITPVKRQRTEAIPTPDDTPNALHAYCAATTSQDNTPTSFFARFSRKPLSPPDTAQKNPRKRAREVEDEQDAGDSTYGSGAGAVAPLASDVVSSESGLPEDQSTRLDDAEASGPSNSANAERLDIRAKDQAEADRQALFALRQAAIEDARATGKCHADELFLFERLSMLCFEPILPSQWQIDFPTLPLILFTETEDLMFINSNHLPASRAIRALGSLLDVGFRVKEKLDVGKSADPMIAKEIQNYVNWAELDGGYSKRRFIPILSVISARPHEDSGTLTTNLSGQMSFLAQQHRKHLLLPPGSLDKHGRPRVYRRTPPLIYGVIVAQSNVFFFTLDAAKEEAKVRHQTYYDMAAVGKEVWNGFAIAILVIMVRDYMMSITAELEVDETIESDPDA